MIILGISAYYHDSAAALVRDGDIIAAAQEERFTRKKHDAGFPAQAITYCLNENKIAITDIDVRFIKRFVGFYEGAKKILVGSYHYYFATFRSIDSICSGLSYRAVYINFILKLDFNCCRD